MIIKQSIYYVLLATLSLAIADDETSWEKHEAYYDQKTISPKIRLKPVSNLRQAYNALMGDDENKEVLEISKESLKLDNDIVLSNTSNESYYSKVFGKENYHQFAQYYKDYKIDEAGINATVLEDNGDRFLSFVDSAVLKNSTFDFRENLTKESAMNLIIEKAKTIGYAGNQLYKSEKILKIIDGNWRPVLSARFRGDPNHYNADMESGAINVESQIFNMGKRKPTPPAPPLPPNANQSQLNINASARIMEYNPILSEFDLTTVPLSGLFIPGSTQSNAFTNFSGYLLYHYNDGLSEIETSLNGKWARIINYKTDGLKIKSSIYPNQADLNIDFNPIGFDESTTAQVNAYVHIGRIHNWLEERKITNKFLKLPLKATVNINNEGGCNAYYTGLEIYFMSGRDKDYPRNYCPNTAYDTVIYHEYGHYVDDTFGNIQNYGLSEGWGDVLAILMTGKPEIGEGFHGKADQALRTAENNYQYPSSNYDEPHNLGQAWSGFVWDLRKNLLNTLGPSGKSVCEDLVLPSLISNARHIPSAVKQVWIRGQKDYRNEILNAAKAHSLDMFLN